MGATILVNGLRPGTKVSDRKQVPWALAMVGFAAVVALATGGENPVQAIVVVQGLTAISIPLIGFFVPFVGENRKLLGDQLAPPRWVTLLAWVGYLVLLLLMANVVRSLVQLVAG